MPDQSCAARIVLTTATNPEEARMLGRAFVEEHLAACATLIPSVESIYRWKGAIESSGETMVLLKTDIDRLAALESRLRQLHSYDVPEFLVLPIENGGRAYLDWMLESLGRVDKVRPVKSSEPED
jgi:periplasmic divalent cation tolerance protein